MNLCVFLLCFGAMLPNKEEKKEPVDYVNPFIGTKSMGHTFPGACVPYGAVQLSPDLLAGCVSLLCWFSV